jgi:polyisoprenoid-binding protein YceI
MRSRCRTLVVIAIAAVSLARNQQKIFTIRKLDSNVGFAVTKWMVVKEEGRFKDFEGTIHFDQKKPAAIQVEFTVYTNSVDSRNSDRDNAIRSRDMLHVAKFPTMMFHSVKATALSETELSVEGDCTIKATTKRITVPVKLLGVQYTGDYDGTVAGFETTFVIDRNDFGATGWPALIGKDVTIHMLIGASDKPNSASN